MSMRDRLRTMGLGAFGLLLVIVSWEVIGRNQLLGRTFPALSDVLATIVDPARRGLFQRALEATIGSALRGFVFGSIIGFAMAALGVIFPPLRAGLDRLAAVMHAVPLIALGPFLIVTLSREGTPTAIATLAVVFNVFVATSAGLRVGNPLHHDVLTVLGAGSWERFRRLELPGALPFIADGLKLAAPAAVIGAILGEWFGAPRGIGIVIVSSLQNYQIDLLWSAALLGAMLSLVAFGAFSVLERWVVGRFR
jgi:ABC-type nitrate/sulfonate/bicarbonate transport system permease component